MEGARKIQGTPGFIANHTSSICWEADDAHVRVLLFVVEAAQVFPSTHYLHRYLKRPAFRVGDAVIGRNVSLSENPLLRR